MKTKLLLSALLSFVPEAGFGFTELRFASVRRKLLNFCLLSFVFCLGTAQVPQGFNYQAIARDGTGNPIVEATIKVKLSILSDTTGFSAGGGAYVWEEEHLNVMTNAYGLFNIVLGDPDATKIQGVASFNIINWNQPKLFIGTKIANPTTYKILGSAKLWSVPYSLLAKNTETKQTLSLAALDLTISGGNTISLPGGSSAWQVNGSDIYRESGKVGIGTNTPNSLLNPSMTIGDELNSTAEIMNLTIKPSFNIEQLRFYGIRKVAGTSWSNVSLRIQQRVDETDMGYIEFNPGAMGYDLAFGTLNTERLRINTAGNVGIGTTTPAYNLDVLGEIASRNFNAFRFRGANFSTILRQDPVSMYFLLTNNGDPDGTWNSLRPFAIDLASGSVSLAGSQLFVQHGGNVGIGTIAPSSKVVIQPPPYWNDSIPLFEVKNKYGTPVFAVYNNGIRILVDHDAVKGITKGGFAIGGFDNTKAGETVNLMTVAPDSIRFNINNNSAKGITKGGFAIGGFDNSKAIVGRFLDVATDASGKVNPAQNRILWYPIKNAFLAGRVFITDSSNVGVNSFATGFESRAKGRYSQAMGYKAIADGDYSTAIGNNAVANSVNSFAFGENANASGKDAFAVGRSAVASGVGSVAIGFVGQDTTGAPTGNTVAMDSFSVAIGMGAQAKSKGALSIGTKTIASGEFSLAMGYQSNASGWLATAIGVVTKSSNFASFSSGDRSVASGHTSFATGSYTKASGGASSTFGQLTEATNLGSFASGWKTISRGWGSSSFGILTKAIGTGAVSMGGLTTAQSYGSLVIGTNNVISGDSTQWTWTDPLFVIGNGYGVSPRNAMTVLKNGNVGIGTTNPGYILQVGNAGDGTQARANGWNLLSDANLKTGFIKPDDPIDMVNNINGYYFYWKTGSDKKRQFGFSAQEVEKVLPEIVSKGEDGLLSLDYGKITPLLVEAIKEQQRQIETQQKEIDELKSLINTLIANQAGKGNK